MQVSYRVWSPCFFCIRFVRVCVSMFSSQSSIKNETEFLDPEHTVTYDTTCKCSNANATLINLQNVHLADFFWLWTQHCWQTGPTDADCTITRSGLMQYMAKTSVWRIVLWSGQWLLSLLCEIKWRLRERLLGGDLVYLLWQSAKLLLYHEVQLGSGCAPGDLYYGLESGYVEPFTSKLRYWIAEGEFWMLCHGGIYIGSFSAGMRSILPSFAKYTIICVCWNWQRVPEF